MKYIRTKDGLYEVLEIDKDWGFLSNSPQTYGDIYIRTDKVIKQADTIEELCDEFVCIGSAEYQKYVKHSLKEALQKKEWLERKGYTCNIYGAIWTDKGLIYKAKMKGILPNGEIDWELL